MQLEAETDDTTAHADSANRPMIGRIINASDWPDLMDTSREGFEQDFEEATISPPIAGPSSPDQVTDIADDVDNHPTQDHDTSEVAATEAHAELLAVAMLMQTLTRSAATGEVLVTFSPETNDAHTAIDPCTRVPIIKLAPELLNAAPVRLYGMLAHKIAHQVLEHRTRPRPWHRLAQGGGAGALLGAVAAIGGRTSWWLVLGLLLIAGLSHLLDARVQRRQEIQADVLAAKVLSRAGRDGYQIITSTLLASRREGAWHRVVGWIVSPQPTTRARLRAVFAADPSARTTLADLSQRADIPLSGTALLTVRVCAVLLCAAATGPLWLHERLNDMFALSGVPALVVSSCIGAAALSTAYTAIRGRPAPLPAYLVLTITAALTLTAALTA